MVHAAHAAVAHAAVVGARRPVGLAAVAHGPVLVALPRDTGTVRGGRETCPQDTRPQVSICRSPSPGHVSPGPRLQVSIFGSPSPGHMSPSRLAQVPIPRSLSPGHVSPSPCPQVSIPGSPSPSPHSQDTCPQPRASCRAVGPLTVTFSRAPTLEQIQAKNPAVGAGGRYRPPACEPRSRTAIVIPHRNRESHLGHLLYYLHPFLQRQQLQYGIYVVHQAGNSTFNRAKLLNVGVKEALKDEEWDCLFLHDVDLIPENDHNLYTCDPWNPKHVSVAMNKFGYSLPYPQYFGGVSALTPDQYMKINGFPNEYWGWGGEDDDIATRVRLAGMKIARPPISIGHYKMVKHKSDKGNEENPHRWAPRLGGRRGVPAGADAPAPLQVRPPRASGPGRGGSCCGLGRPGPRWPRGARGRGACARARRGLCCQRVGIYSIYELLPGPL
uniref:Beta-1,4-galactosyltransferase n=1 Tax=Nothoprocta perdicaria TaxID=30464 RepID=A0A8C6YV57_NOTPE